MIVLLLLWLLQLRHLMKMWRKTFWPNHFLFYRSESDVVGTFLKCLTAKLGYFCHKYPCNFLFMSRVIHIIRFSVVDIFALQSNVNSTIWWPVQNSLVGQITKTEKNATLKIDIIYRSCMSALKCNLYPNNI